MWYLGEHNERDIITGKKKKSLKVYIQTKDSRNFMNKSVENSMAVV